MVIMANSITHGHVRTMTMAESCKMVAIIHAALVYNVLL